MWKKYGELSAIKILKAKNKLWNKKKLKRPFFVIEIKTPTINYSKQFPMPKEGDTITIDFKEIILEIPPLFPPFKIH